MAKPTSLTEFLQQRVDQGDGDPKLIEAVSSIMFSVDRLDDYLAKGDAESYAQSSYTYGILEDLGDLWSDHPDYDCWH